MPDRLLTALATLIGQIPSGAKQDVADVEKAFEGIPHALAHTIPHDFTTFKLRKQSTSPWSVLAAIANEITGKTPTGQSKHPDPLLSNQTHVTLSKLQQAAGIKPRTLYAENIRYLLSPFQHTLNQLPSEYLSAMQSALSPTASPYTPSGSEAPEEQSMEAALQNLGSKTSPMYKALKGMGVDMRGYERVAPYTSLITGLISHLRYLTEYTGAGSLSPHVPGWLQTLAATSAGSGPVQFGKGSTGNMAQEMLKVKGLSTKKQTTTTPTSTSTNSTPG